MINIGYKFYKEYFSKLKLDKNNGKAIFDGKDTYEDLKHYSLSNYSKCNYYFDNELITKEATLKLSTTYPGLLIGSGYIHEIGGMDNELKLGFFFDHTTGLPIIPASSVKGLLRSAFEKAIATETIDNKEYKASLYVQELLEDITKTDWSFEDINKLEKNIFEGEKGKSIYKRDIFFDAFPEKSENDNNVFLANDYITHHEHPLKNPNPIQFLKILPQVTFQFNFKLENEELLSAENKKKFFKQILLDLGIGAKTNVGYGQFEYKKPPIIRLEEKLTKKHLEVLVYEVYDQQKNIFKAKIIEKNDNDYLFEVLGLDECYIRKTIVSMERYMNNASKKRINRGKSGIYKVIEIGDEIEIRLNKITGNELVNFTVLPIWIENE